MPLTFEDRHHLCWSMGDELYICLLSCNGTNKSGALVGNDSFDLECITLCSQRHANFISKYGGKVNIRTIFVPIWHLDEQRERKKHKRERSKCLLKLVDRCSKSLVFRYTQILQIIAVVLMTFGLIGKVFNCIIFLRPPVIITTVRLVSSHCLVVVSLGLL